ncbi:hypothetical protein EIP91_004120 [Steccherinum ochraceum]|uniref:Major facilitator superfamily (MFS) profile domain-containing protein n=1 Tax=Steccherinum ochraceum TaxID=92696 RepID=A0A4R0RPS8_9APHY|nr:hypothetical protein EIP91_004120 [Steccherinum ochraceum]
METTTSSFLPSSSTSRPSSLLNPSKPLPSKNPKGSAFWLSFLALITCTLLSVLDLTGVATVLPTITADLNGGDDFVWIGSAYALASTAILPLTGGLADVFGRKPVMLGCIVLFCAGSAVSGAAGSMGVLIGARTIQGLGGGGITNLISIIVSDLVPLSERGAYQGFISLTYSFAAGIGPPLAGVFAQKASWRWLFYMNLPLTGIAFILVFFFLRVRTPPGTMREKFSRIDWSGNLIIVAGTTLAVLGLTWAGTRYPWSSAHVLAPLLIGLLLIIAFGVYEVCVPGEPTIPFKVLVHRNTIAGYVGTAVHGVVSISAIYYLPVYFQGALATSPLRASVEILPMSLVMAPFGLFCGISVKKFNKYVPQNIVGWVVTIIGFGVMSLLKADSSEGRWVGYQVLMSAGAGVVWAGTIFPILAPVPVAHTAPALAFYTFTRSFAQTWGITLSATILQNRLAHTLPASFVSLFPDGAEIAVLGLVSALWLKEVPMGDRLDETYGLDVKTEVEAVQIEGKELSSV